ncbi:MAG: endonuclease/exonuclease/phosphatase family protein [Anaerolineae bacterium]|nr:MAG: endonuclease/exonuclease/phosphatase family protein [Anaerolineae bacterium]
MKTATLLRTFLRTLLWAAADLAALGLVALTIAGFAGKLWWILDLFSHFRVQYLVGLLGMLLVFGWGKRRGASLVGAAALINLLLIAPLHLPPAQPETSSAVYTLWYANVHTENALHTPTRKQIEHYSPDIVALVEPDQRWLDDLHLSDLYPYRVEIPRPDNFGLALYSRWPIANWEVRDFTGLGLPTLVARLESPGGPLRLVLTHTMPPKGKYAAQLRDAHMTRLAAYIAEQDGAVMLVGDLNATSWTPYFRGWLRASGLRDSRRGFGVQATWPAAFWPLRVPIDHILISPQIAVRQRAVGADIGSDHLPLWLQFDIHSP